MESDPIPNQDEDFDSEKFADLIDLINAYKSGEWVDLIAPCWWEQIKEMQAHGYLTGIKVP